MKTSISIAGISSLFLTLGSFPAKAIDGFTGAYDPSKFTFSSDPAGAGNITTDLDITNASSGTVILYGSDNANNGLGTGNPANNSWSINIGASQAGTISFAWSFLSVLDQVGDDTASYFINGIFTPLATANGDIQSSSNPVVLNLSVGDVFGFQVSSQTNNGGEGALTISNFQATPVPFETDALPILVGLAFMGGGMWLKRRLNSP